MSAITVKLSAVLRFVLNDVGNTQIDHRYIPIVYNANLMTSVMRPDPRYELALALQVPHTQTEHPDMSAVAVTCNGWMEEDHSS